MLLKIHFKRPSLILRELNVHSNCKPILSKFKSLQVDFIAILSLTETQMAKQYYIYICQNICGQHVLYYRAFLFKGT